METGNTNSSQSHECRSDDKGHCSQSHSSSCSTCCSSTPNPSVCQNLVEMDFERGIWQAAIDDDVPRITHLISNQNVDVNVTDTYGYTALHYAARNGKLSAAKCLIRHGARVNCQTRNNGATPLHRAISAGTPTMVQYLLDNGADVSIRDYDQKSSIERAQKEENQEVLAILEDRDRGS